MYYIYANIYALYVCTKAHIHLGAIIYALKINDTKCMNKAGANTYASSMKHVGSCQNLCIKHVH